MLDIHASALAKGNTALHEFLLYYRNDAQLVYGFVEGRDDPVFYRGLIEQFLDDGWAVKLIVAGDKKRVLDVFAHMDWARFPRKRVCFFIDRDLCDFVETSIPESDNLYVTDGYSVENSIVNEETLDRAFEEVFGIQLTSPKERDQIHNLFSTSRSVFCDTLLPVMAQILVWRRTKSPACLENMKLKEWFAFRDGALETTPAYGDTESRLAIAAEWCQVGPVPADQVNSAIQELLNRSEVQRVVRGKYLMWFFAQWLLSARNSIGKHCAKYATRAPKLRVPFGPENGLVVLANKARAPRSLRHFVQSTYLAYCRGESS